MIGNSYQYELGIAYAKVLNELRENLKKMDLELVSRHWEIRQNLDERVHNCEMNIQNITIYQSLQKIGFKVTLSQVSNLHPHRQFVVTHRNREFYFYPYQF